MTWENIPKEIKDYQGFVYLIKEIDTDMCYIGKKNFWKKIKRPPLSGKKRRRIEIVESDWKKYNSSNKLLQIKLINEPDNYRKVILKACLSKQDMAIYEAYYQLKIYIEGDWDKLYNQVINLRVRAR